MNINQNNNVLQDNNLIKAKNLIQRVAIISTIFAVPFIGSGLGMIFQIPMIVLVVIIVTGLKQIRNVDISKTGLTMALIASSVSIAGFLCVLLYSVIRLNSRGITSGVEEVLIICYRAAGFIAWVFYVIAAITLFVELSKINNEIRNQMIRFNSATMMQREPVFTANTLNTEEVMPKFQNEAPIPVVTAVPENNPKPEVQIQTLLDNEVHKSIASDEKVNNNPFHIPNKREKMEEKDKSLFSNGWIEE